MSRYFKKLLDEYEQAVVNRAFKGSMNPDDWDEIEEEYTYAKQRLLNYLKHKGVDTN